MASAPLVQIPDTVVDAVGLSLSTSPRLPTDPRQGSAYDNTTIAAAVPIHFHHMSASALGGDNFMMLSSQRWYAGTPLSTDPGYLSSFTVDDDPNWVMINAATGIVSTVNSGTEIPMSTPADSRILVAAASRGTDMLYTLTEVTQGDDDLAVVQHWNNNTVINTLHAIGEETVPPAVNGPDDIVFTAGLHYSAATDPYMHLFGTGSSSGAVYMARKPWASIGQIGIPTRPLIVDWEFFTGTGWLADPTSARPVQTDTGATMLSAGPMSFANLALPRRTSGKTLSYALAATTVLSGSTVTAQVYSSLSGRPWSALGAPIALGTVGSTYLGGTLQLQSGLGANPALVDSGSSAAVPYVISYKETLSGAHRINTAWGLIQIPQLA